MTDEEKEKLEKICDSIMDYKLVFIDYEGKEFPITYVDVDKENGLVKFME